MIVEIIDGRPKGFISVEECATKNNVSRSLVMKRIREGKVISFYIDGGTYRIWWIKEDGIITDERKIKGRNKYSRTFKNYYPHNLICDIFGENYAWEGNADQIAGLEYALSTLDKREQEFIKIRYHDYLTYNDIGEKYSITKERVRQILAKARRKLKNINRSVYIQNGLETTNEAKRPAYSDYVLDKYGCSDAFYHLNLSVRSFNCLRRADIGTVKGIIEAIKNDKIFKIRKFGEKCYEEVAEKLEEYYGKSFEQIIEGETESV